MPNSWFQFKKFIIHQDLTAMKVGTDGVLLGAWCSVEKAVKILDVGTGTGVLAMMAAQRSEADIDAIEIDYQAYKQARENVRESIFSSRIRVIYADFLDFASTCQNIYDSIISNPPYFDSLLKPNDKSRKIARHNEALSLQSLIQTSSKLLCQAGKISLILPFDKEVQAREIAAECGFKPCRSLAVRGHATRPAKRILVEWSKNPGGPEIFEQLTILDKNNNYSQAYINLTRDFYLEF